MIHLDVLVKRADLVFDPPLEQLENTINRLVTVIVESAHELPRVSTCTIHVHQY